MSIESMMLSNHFILGHPLLLLLASRSFPVSQFFATRCPNIETSASAPVFSMNIELISFRIDWFDLLSVQGTLKGLLEPHN